MKEFEKRAQAWLDGDFDQETKMKVLQLKNSDPALFEDAFYLDVKPLVTLVSLASPAVMYIRRLWRR